MECTRHIFRESYCVKCRRLRGFVCAVCGYESDVNLNDPYSRPVQDEQRCTCDDAIPQVSHTAEKNALSSERIAAIRARRRARSMAPDNQEQVINKPPADSPENVPAESGPLWGISRKQWAILIILGAGAALAFFVMFLISVSALAR